MDYRYDFTNNSERNKKKIIFVVIFSNKDETYYLSDDIKNIGKNYDIIVLDSDDDYLFSLAAIA